ncbi:HlyD family type I secretion periplasmic adaptor subunit [Neptunomonas phycophila]|uniref:HlyD family type I secretion periplasmic adaptor subunit n=1 Tax=Neptunomonas phycophila TaxID=1572645 RepID=UPI0015BD95D9|nr:HlyD family type I secretion periplasmic adaptor subunit [Neptunomonas phycophila]QLE97662.1 HlyD family type I secretion periplasmic adaptor subunit [Neptunomonas phycophila]
MDSTDRLENNEHVLSTENPIINIGFLFIISLIVIFIAWANYASLESATLAPAVVEVKSHRKIIQHLYGGIVETIYVSDGDIVNEGQLLVALDGSDIKTEYNSDLLLSYEIIAKIERLKHELDNKRDFFMISKKYDYNPHILANLNAQKKILATRKLALLGEGSIIDNQINQAKEKIKKLSSLTDNKKKLLKSLNVEISNRKRLVDKGFLGEMGLNDLSREILKYTAELNDIKSEKNLLNIKINEYSLRKQQIINVFRKQVVEELEVSKQRLSDLNKKLPVLSERIRRLTIVSPVSGRVMDVQIHTLGGVIKSGQNIMVIVPENDDLIFSAKISPEDIEDVYPGLEANIRLTSFNTPNTPEVRGKVITVSADSLVDKNNESYFEAKIALNEDSLKVINEIDLSAGMPAEVLVLTGKSTLLEYLIKPISDVFSRSFIEK